ncbi:SDR family NAD(P)-dependent oxidoreductase [Candidatus Poriferisocius sp.]|uniref:SDR family NAD(P)-dependent oxidoreductase n=1 Tax=Candidatus Poriferisocius sp. TaxID=3101276 RepID=UPI003B027367
MNAPKPRRALVTGAASGIGAGAARRLLRGGVDVMATDIYSHGLAALAELGAEPLTADLADPRDRDQVIEAASGVDYLVQAAGIIRLLPIEKVTVDDWREVFAVNAEAMFFLCQGIGATMPAGGAIVNLSSSSAKLTNTTEAAVYAASKAAVLSITRSFAYSLAPIPVRVNAICPGIIDTPMQDVVLEEVSAIRGLTPQQLSDLRESSVPLGRGASPDELAELIWFLLSDGAGYMTGQAVNFDGGLVTW